MNHAILFLEPIYLRFQPGAVIFLDEFNLLCEFASARLTRGENCLRIAALLRCGLALFAFVLLVISLIRFHPQWSIYLLRRGRYNKLEGLYSGQNIYIGRCMARCMTHLNGHTLQ